MGLGSSNSYVISFRDENLLKNSEVIKDQPLISSLLEREDRVTYAELTIQQHDYISRIYNKVIYEASTEWYVVDGEIGYSDEEDFRCQLCGQPIIHIYRIKNIHNNNWLWIGSECTKHFRIQKYSEKIISPKNLKKQNRVDQLANVAPGIEILVLNWDKYLDSVKYYMKEEETSKYISLGKETKKIHERYLSSSISKDKAVEMINNIVIEANKEKKKIVSLIMKYDNDLLAPKKEYIHKVKEYQKASVIQSFEKNSRIGRDIIWMIKDEGLTNSIIEATKDDFRRIGFKHYKTIEYNKEIGVILRHENLKNVDLYCSHRCLVRALEDKLYSGEVNDKRIFNTLLRGLNVLDYYMRIHCSKLILDSIGESKYELVEINNYSSDFRGVRIHNIYNNRFYVLNHKIFVDKFLRVLLINEEDCREEILSHIRNNVREVNNNML